MTTTHPFPDFLWNKMKASANEGPYYDSFLTSPFPPVWLFKGLIRQDTHEGPKFWTAIQQLYLAGDPSEIDVLRVFGEFGVSMY